MVLAVAVDHPVFSISADLQLESGDEVGLVCLFRDCTLGGDARQYLQEVQVHLRRRNGKISLNLCCYKGFLL